MVRRRGCRALGRGSSVPTAKDSLGRRVAQRRLPWPHPTSLLLPPLPLTATPTTPTPAPHRTPLRYQGSADAVRKNIGELKDEARGITPARDYVILSGSGAATAAPTKHWVEAATAPLHPLPCTQAGAQHA